MADEYTEPTNKQLASFLMVYATQIPETAGLELNAGTLEMLMDTNPTFRKGALRHHRRFQERINELHQKMLAGELQCEHILKSGKQCPNRNEPGIPWCGLHKGEHGEGESSGEDA